MNPKLAALLESTAFYTENTVIIQIIAKTYVQWWRKKTEKEETIQELRKEQQGIERSNWEKKSEIC